MFVDNLRKMLIAGPGSKLPQLSQRYSASFKKCSGFLDKSAKQVASSAEARDKAWNLFYDYCANALKVTICNGRLDLFELEDAQILAEKFLSVLFPDKDYYAEEICSRLNYVAKHALNLARTVPLPNMPSPDSYSPMDSPDSFRQMLSCHLEQSAELNCGIKQNGNEDENIVAVQTKLLEITFEQSRYQANREEYARCEARYDSCIRSLKMLTGGNVVSTPAIPAQLVSLSRPVWLIRSTLKEHMHLTKTDSLACPALLTWKTISSIKSFFREQKEKTVEHHFFSKQNSR